ncbi:hypothetical protein [Rheinheimera faecalis]
MAELKCYWDRIKRGSVVMSLQKLKQRALDNPEVKAEYQKLEAEFSFIEQQLPMLSQVGNSQSKLSKNTNSEE